MSRKRKPALIIPSGSRGIIRPKLSVEEVNQRDFKAAEALIRGDYGTVEAICRENIESFPGDWNSYMMLGMAAHKRGRSDEGVAYLRHAITCNPMLPNLYQTLGAILSERGCHAEALACLQRALKINGKFSDAWFELGNTFGRLGMMRSSAEALQQAFESAPEGPLAQLSLANRIFSIDVGVEHTADEAWEARQDYWRRFGEPLVAQQQPHTNDPDPDRVLRVGLSGSDFRMHSAWLSYSALICEVDRAQIEFHLYASQHDKDAATQALLDHGAVYHDVRGVSDADVADRVRADGIDVLVDLSGYSAGSRLPMFALKPAPIQASGWGYATGTGFPTIDYFLGDPVATPAWMQPRFAERIAHLPVIIGYNTPSDTPLAEGLPCEKNAQQPYPLTFGYFGRPLKVSPRTLDVWARVLKAVPTARLLLAHDSFTLVSTEMRIRDHLEAEGVPHERLWLAGMAPPRLHLLRNQEADIGLDPLGQSGGISAAEILWQGVPNVTFLHPEAVVGRIAASISTHLGLDDLVATTEDEYVGIAVAWANDPERRRRFRETIRPRMLASAMCDGKQYARAFEALVRGWWRAWCAARVPADSRRRVATL